MITLLVSYSIHAQETKTWRTYYDAITQTKVHEEWTTIPSPTNIRGMKHGPYKEYDAAGNLIRLKNYKNGSQDGPTKIYYFMPDGTGCYGKLTLEGNYLNGKKHGVQKDYDCDQGLLILRNESVYDNGQIISEKLFHRDGSPEAENTLDGRCRRWNSKGILILDYTNKNGRAEGLYTEYHNNGNVGLQGTMSNGEYVGDWISYYPQGSILAEYTENPNLPYFEKHKAYSTGGKVKSETRFNPETGWHDVVAYDSISGNILYSESRKYTSMDNYKIIGNKAIFYTNGEKKRTIQYNERGNVVKRVMFDREGTSIGSFECDNWGTPIGDGTIFISDGTFHFAPDSAVGYWVIQFDDIQSNADSVKEYTIDGQLNGKGLTRSNGRYNYLPEGHWVYYHSIGNISSEGDYEYGRKKGEWQVYGASGELESIQIYQYGELRSMLSKEEVNARMVKSKKHELINKYADYKNQNDNKYVRYYQYTSEGKKKVMIFDAAIGIMNHYLRQIEGCSDLASLDVIEMRLKRMEDVLDKFQYRKGEKLMWKLTVISDTKKIEKLLID